MADIVYVKSIAELVDPKLAASSLSWTAGGASDAVTWTGYSIDRQAFVTGSMPRSVDVFVAYDCTLASGSTLSFTFDVQDSADNSAWSDYATEAITVFSTGTTGGPAKSGIARMSVAAGNANAPTGTPGVDLNQARRYVRCNVVPHLSRAGTDTAVMVTIADFGGFDILAAPKT